MGVFKTKENIDDKSDDLLGKYGLIELLDNNKDNNKDKNTDKTKKSNDKKKGEN